MSSSDQDTAVTDVGRAEPVAQASDCLVVIYKRDGGPGRCIKLQTPVVRIGRDPDNDVVLEEIGVSRRHARLERRGDRLVIMDVGSTNGTLVNDLDLDGVRTLENDDRIKVGGTIFKYLRGSDVDAAFHEQIYICTITDELTRLHNKRYFLGELATEFSRARRHGRALSVLVLDIDHFKRVNDEYHHTVGDVVLRSVASAVRDCVREHDVAARFGGEELAVLLPETHVEEARNVAERLRRRIEETEVTYRDIRLSVTVSIGCAEFQADDAEPIKVFERADAQMYAAKAAGRNRVA